MILIEEIQAATVDQSNDLGTILRKCKLLAARLGSQPLETWLIYESNGYPPELDVPDYRVWTLEVKGDFTGPFGSMVRNAPIPLIFIPERVRDYYNQYKCRQSIATLEALLEQSKAGGGTWQVPTRDLAVVLGTKVYQDQSCIKAWAEFSAGSVMEVLNTVRNRILDFALALWKDDPKAGEVKENSEHHLEPTKVTQIFNTTIYGGSANLVGTATDS